MFLSVFSAVHWCYYVTFRLYVFGHSVVLVKLARKIPLQNPICGKEIISMHNVAH